MVARDGVISSSTCSLLRRSERDYSAVTINRLLQNHLQYSAINTIDSITQHKTNISIFMCDIKFITHYKIYEDVSNSLLALRHCHTQSGLTWSYREKLVHCVCITWWSTSPLVEGSEEITSVASSCWNSSIASPPYLYHMCIDTGSCEITRLTLLYISLADDNLSVPMRWIFSYQ